jgi:hypothetical protein
MPDSLFQALIRDISGRTGRPVAQEPQARFEETVDVVAKPRDKFATRYPPDSAEMARIHLGSATEPPTGTYLPPDTPPTSANFEGNPNLAAAWKRIQTQYPSVSRYANARTDDALAGTNTLGSVDFKDPRTIRVNPTLERLLGQYGEDTMRHELVHVANMLNQPNGSIPKSTEFSEEAADATQTGKTPGGMDLVNAFRLYQMSRAKTRAY